MTDLLNSLIDPQLTSSPSSQKSFHTTGSPEAPSAANTNVAPHPNGTPPKASTDLSTTGIPVEDIEAFLRDCEPLPEFSAPKRKATSSNPNAGTTTGEPVLIGSTSNYVSTLTSLCQAKGLPNPVFEIDGQADIASFNGGVLHIGDVTVARDGYWKSKKEAREGLAEKGLEIVKEMPARVKERSNGSGGGEKKNWVGMLQEYHQAAFGAAQSPLYNYYAINSSFSATCTLNSYPAQAFGSSTTAFPSKKAAQVNAAKAAVQRLISDGKLNADGSPLGRKKMKLGTAVKLEEKGIQVVKGATYVQKVQDLSPLLGLPPPQYHIHPASPSTPNLLCGHAAFPNSPYLPEEMGEVRNVFGKKTAREEIARGVWEGLRALAERRGVRAEEVDVDVEG